MLLKGTRTAVLTLAALNDLMGQDECCPHCCPKCWVLQDMIKKGDINTVLTKAPIQMLEASSWWGARSGQVKLAMVTSRWTGTCEVHDQLEELEKIGG